MTLLAVLAVGLLVGVAVGVWLERADQRLIRNLELEMRGNR